MNFSDIGLPFLLAFLIGAAIGIEREVNEKSGEYQQKPSATLGLRTFSLVSVLGAIVGALIPSFLLIGVTLTAGFIALLLFFYFHEVAKTQDHGITTEIALLYTFIIGLLLILKVIPIQMTLALSIIVMLLLSQKQLIKQKMQAITSSELNAFIAFAMIAIAVLPFLPNITYSLKEIPGIGDLIKNAKLESNELLSIELINPFKLWLYVALITGVDLIGYILQRLLGRKCGWILASIAGGFVSSTATTQSLAQQSKKSKNVNSLVSAAVLANVVSFVQIGILILPLNISLFISLVPILLLMLVSGIVITIYYLKKEQRQSEDSNAYETSKKIINLKGALVFVGLFLLVNLFSKIGLLLFGEGGLLLTTGLGAMVGLDAVMINIAQLTTSTITITLASIAFIIANSVNLSAKIMYSYLLGTKEFTKKFGLGMAIIIILSIIPLFIKF